MKELNLFSEVINEDCINSQTISSVEIAEFANKRHSDVLEAIRNMEPAWEKVHGRKFPLTFVIKELPNGASRKDPIYRFSKMESLFVITKFHDEARARLIVRWEELERGNGSFNLPKTKIEALEQLLASEKRNAALEAENAKKAEIIKEQKPAVEFTNAVQGSKSSILIGDLAKLIAQNGIDMGQNRLFEWLRGNDYLISYGSRRNTPMQKYIDMGLFEVKEGVRTNEDGASYTTLTTRVTGKGQVYFVSKFLKMKIENQILNQ